MLWILFIAVLLLTMQGVVAQDTSGTLMHDNVERTYALHVPETYVPGNALVIALHDYASSGQAIAAHTGLNSAADTFGFMAVYPDSLDLYWDAGQIGNGWPLGSESVDDVGFLTQLLDDLQAEYDAGVVYVTGFGQGGALAYRLACSIPDRLNAVAVIGALLSDYHVANCEDVTAPISMLIAVGTDDLVYPLEGRTLTSTSDGQTAQVLKRRGDGCFLVGSQSVSGHLTHKCNSNCSIIKIVLMTPRSHFIQSWAVVICGCAQGHTP